MYREGIERKHKLLLEILVHEIEFHLFNLRRQLAHANAIPEQVNEDDREGE